MPTVTLSQLQERVYSGLDTAVGLYPSAQVTAILNEGLRRLNLLVGWNQATVPVPGFSVAGQLIYNTPAGVIVPLSIWFEQRKLNKVSLRSISNSKRTWITDTTATAGPVRSWAPLGISRFAIHPADAYGDRLIEVTGVAPVVPLVNPGDVVNLENQWADALALYVKSRIRLKEGGQRFAADSLAYQRFINAVKPALIWQGMKFPQYWVSKELEKDTGRGT